VPVIREFRCSDCGSTFESMLPVAEVCCPKCSGEEPERVFLTPPAIRSSHTTGTDKTLQGLAADYGLTNMTNKDGGPVKRAPDGPEAPSFATGNPQAMAALQRLGGNADGFSGVLPSLQRAGRPHQWHKTHERGK
jgi:putative FmdB family regulatory protein